MIRLLLSGLFGIGEKNRLAEQQPGRGNRTGNERSHGPPGLYAKSQSGESGLWFERHGRLTARFNRLSQIAWRNGQVSVPTAMSAVALVRGRLGSRMHAMLRHFVDTAGRRLDLVAIKMIERIAAFAGRIAFFDGLGDVGLGQHGGFD